MTRIASTLALVLVVATGALTQASDADTKAILEEATHYVGIQALRAELAMAPRKGTTLARKLLGESPARQLELAVMERRHPTVPPARVPLPTS